MPCAYRSHTARISSAAYCSKDSRRMPSIGFGNTRIFIVLALRYVAYIAWVCTLPSVKLRTVSGSRGRICDTLVTSRVTSEAPHCRGAERHRLCCWWQYLVSEGDSEYCSWHRYSVPDVGDQSFTWSGRMSTIAIAERPDSRDAI